MQAFLNKLKAHIGEKKEIFQLKSVLINNMRNVLSCQQAIS